MHTLIPTSRTYYIAMDADGNVTGSGYVDPGERLDSGAAQYQTYQTPEAMNTALIASGSPADLTTIDPSASVATQKIAMCAKVNQIRTIKLALPVTYNGHRFDSDEAAISNLNGMCAVIGVGIPVPQGFTWRSTDNVNVPMTAQQLVGLVGAMMVYRSACYQNSWALKAAINASDEPLMVHISDGWPG